MVSNSGWDPLHMEDAPHFWVWPMEDSPAPFFAWVHFFFVWPVYGPVFFFGVFFFAGAHVRRFWQAILEQRRKLENMCGRQFAFDPKFAGRAQ